MIDPSAEEQRKNPGSVEDLRQLLPSQTTLYILWEIESDSRRRVSWAMQPPIPIGTVLQNRYRLLQILGQGGFGRTYLAADQGRFNEYCALKEFTPPQNSDYALEKSQELFEREASVLHKIRHPQVPEFKAVFEEGNRFFLVQDYIEGKPYSDLLDERLQQGGAFSPDEVLELIQQLLPVLSHIHGKGIIHRDISPDNIMYREQDGQPVLIDFGVVKAVATQLQGDSTTGPTTVGKPGYAPSEQIRGGEVYPCSDLFALAVTAIVLMTGRQPMELFDSNQMTWRWQSFVSHVPERLAAVLNRMLSYRPGDRYQSAVDVIEALDSLSSMGSAAKRGSTPTGIAPSAPSAEAASATSREAEANAEAPASQMRTVAVGRAMEASYERSGPPGQVRPVESRTIRNRRPPEQPESSFWDDPVAVGAVGAGIVALAGIGSWTIFSTLGREPAPPTPVATVAPSPAPSPTPAAPVQAQQTIKLLPGQPQEFTRTLGQGESITYRFEASRGDRLSASLINSAR